METGVIPRLSVDEVFQNNVLFIESEREIEIIGKINQGTKHIGYSKQLLNSISESVNKVIKFDIKDGVSKDG